MTRKRGALLASAVLAISLAVLNTAGASSAADQPNRAAPAVQTQRLDPTPVDAPPIPRPFLKMFFSAADARNSIFVPSGWIGALDENGIVGTGHDAIDLNLPTHPDFGWGTPIYAGAYGRAYWSYQRIPSDWTDPATGIVHHISIGGLVAEVRYSEDGGATPNGQVAQMFHFSRVNPALHYLPPVFQGPGQWFPADLIQSDATMWGLGTPVKPDTIIGWMGYSGLNKDCVEDFDVVTGTVSRCPSWDKPHVHVQFYGGRNCTALRYGEVQLNVSVQLAACTKRDIIDPASWWAQVSGEWGTLPHFNVYTPVPGVLRYGPRSVFLTDRFGLPIYARS